MAQKTVILDGERITVTQYGDNDYDIYFDLADYSVRGTFLDIIRTFAEWQSSVLDEPAVSFEWQDRTISDPWLDPSARFPLDSDKAGEKYGIENVFRFIIDACDLLHPDYDRKGV